MLQKSMVNRQEFTHIPLSTFSTFLTVKVCGGVTIHIRLLENVQIAYVRRNRKIVKFLVVLINVSKAIGGGGWRVNF